MSVTLPLAIALNPEEEEHFDESLAPIKQQLDKLRSRFGTSIFMDKILPKLLPGLQFSRDRGGQNNKQTTMSDLVPALSTVLKEKSLADAKEELDYLHSRVEPLASINVIHKDDTDLDGHDDVEDIIFSDDGIEDIVIYASGNFDEGIWGRKEGFQDVMWNVPLDDYDRPTTCKLKDLEKCLICGGGGFTMIQSLLTDNSEAYWVKRNGKIECQIFYWGERYDIWVFFSIDGWPQEEWEPVVLAADNDPVNHLIQYLRDTVARNHPEATARFTLLSFMPYAIQGPLKRVVTIKRKQQLLAEQKQLLAEQVVELKVLELREFIGIAVERIANKVNDRSWLPDRDFEKVLEVFVDCGLHNYKTTDDEGKGIKVDLIVDHLELYREEGLKSLRQKAATNLKEKITHLISLQADSEA